MSTLKFIILSNLSCAISHNVLGWRRLGQVIGQCVALTPAPNVGGEKPCRGQSPNTVFRNPEAARMGGGTLTVC